MTDPVSPTIPLGLVPDPHHHAQHAHHAHHDGEHDPEHPASANYGSKTASGNPRIYNCKQCNRAFTREEHLTRHTLSTHNKLKPFTCGICQRPFSRRDLLLRHAKNLHQGSELAVSRIRKSYRRNESHQGGPEDFMDAPDAGEADGDYKNLLPTVSSATSSPNTRRSIDNSDLMNTSAISTTSSASSDPPIAPVLPDPPTSTYSPPQALQTAPTSYDDPQKKRMKMSVNMLVS